MVTDLADKAQEIKSLKVDFFTQQEALVRETNLLKNKLSTASGSGSVGRSGTNVNQTSVDHFLAPPPPPPYPYPHGGGGGGDLRDLLQKEALLQDLHEQIVTIGESGKEGRELGRKRE
jgi:hypothetical protein